MPGMHDVYRRRVPPPLRRALTGAVRRAAWVSGITLLRSGRRGATPSDRTLDLLRIGWGNPLYSSSTPYLREVAERCATAGGTIVEAGSGLTTVIASHVAPPHRRVIALEHLPEWADRVDRRIRRGSAPVRRAPLHDYGGFEWYRLDEPLPDDIELFVCDGPPGSTKGGRYGGVALLRDHMVPGAVILLDDADRAGERDVLRRWEADFGVDVEIRGHGRESYALARTR